MKVKYVFLFFISFVMPLFAVADDRPLPELEGGLFGMEIELRFYTPAMEQITNYIDFADLDLKNELFEMLEMFPFKKGAQRLRNFLDDFNVRGSLTEKDIPIDMRQRLGLETVETVEVATATSRQFDIFTN